MPDMMTTKDSFPVVDVTHKPKRMQSANLKAAQKDEPADSTEIKVGDVPQTVTIERAISFYESHAEGDYKVLYTQTAKWLREFLSKSVPVKSESENSGGEQ